MRWHDDIDAITPSHHRHRIVAPSHHRHCVIASSFHRHHTIAWSSSNHRTIDANVRWCDSESDLDSISYDYKASLRLVTDKHSLLTSKCCKTWLQVKYWTVQVIRNALLKHWKTQNWKNKIWLKSWPCPFNNKIYTVNRVVYPESRSQILDKACLNKRYIVRL